MVIPKDVLKSFILMKKSAKTTTTATTTTTTTTKKTNKLETSLKKICDCISIVVFDFNFEIVNFPFLDGDVPRSPSYGVYISQLIRFARVCSNVDDFNKRNLFLTAKLY